MSFGGGCSDILVGIRLAKYIYEKGFVQDSSAALRYQEFRNDIRDFARLLTDLNAAIIAANQQWRDRPIQVRAAGTAYNPLSDDFDAERKQLIGDFNATLQKCNVFLLENKGFRNGSNALQNIMWHGLSGSEGAVDELRKRLKFHHTKILLVIDRLSLGLLTDVDANVRHLIGLSERHMAISINTQSLLQKLCNSWSGHVAGDTISFDPGDTDVHFASTDVAQRFEWNAEHGVYAIGHGPISLSDASLAEAFDLLLVHFEASVEDNGRGQSPQQYLALLKARWLLAELKQTTAYQQARPCFYYKRAIAQIEQAMDERVWSGVIIQYDDRTLLNLPEKCFRIWPCVDEEVVSRPDPTIARAGEIEVARVDLAPEGMYSTDTVVVLQREAHRYRIVPKFAVEGRFIFDAYDDKLIPRYALPSQAKFLPEIAIFSRGEEMLYRFQKAEDMHAFQRALLGYEVHHSQRDIKCAFSDKTLKCMAEIQIWQDPLKIDNSSDGGPISPIASTQSSDSSLNSGFRAPSIAPSLTPTTIARTKDGFQTRRIAYPALTMFTTISSSRGQDRLAILYLKLDQDIRIFTEHCGCGDETTYDECPLLSLERPKGQKFSIKVLYSDMDRNGQIDPNTWDLLPFRIPQHPGFAKLGTRETTFLLLKFKTPEAKKIFHQELKERFSIRERQLQEQQEFRKWMLYRQDRPFPKAVPTTAPQDPQRSSSITRSLSTCTAKFTSRLKSLDLGPNFAEEVVNETTADPLPLQWRSPVAQEYEGSQTARAQREPRSSGRTLSTGSNNSRLQKETTVVPRRRMTEQNLTSSKGYCNLPR